MHSLTIKVFSMAAMLLMLASCASTNAGEAMDPTESKPTIFAAVADAPCVEVGQRIKRNMKNDPDLGLALEEPVDNGMTYELPIIHKGDLRYSGTVRVWCKDPKFSRVSVGLEVRRKDANGDWVMVDDTTGLEREILDKVLKP